MKLRALFMVDHATGSLVPREATTSPEVAQWYLQGIRRVIRGDLRREDYLSWVNWWLRWKGLV